MAAGPAAAATDREWGKARAALVSRVDLFSGSRGPLSLAGFARALVIPSHDGGAFAFGAVGFGVRLQ